MHKFKIGQIWEDRKGRKCRIENILVTEARPIAVSIPEQMDWDIYYHYPDGRFKQELDTEDDLIRLIEDIVPKFEIGQVWETRDGKHQCRIEVIGLSSLSGRYVSGRFSGDYGHMERYLNGCMSETGDWRDLDLVKLIHEPASPPEPGYETNWNEPKIFHANDCPCFMRKHGFIGHERWCPEFRTYAQMVALGTEIPVNVNEIYKTDSDVKGALHAKVDEK